MAVAVFDCIYHTINITFVSYSVSASQRAKFSKTGVAPATVAEGEIYYQQHETSEVLAPNVSIFLSMGILFDLYQEILYI